MAEQTEAPGCSKHPGATMRRNGVRNGVQRWRCAQCHTDSTAAKRQADFTARHPEKARARKRTYEKKRLARLKEERAAAKLAKLTP